MRLPGKKSAAVLAGIFLATTAWAQKEQWLQYHTSREGRGYHWLDLTTNAPPGVALPKLNAKPYFVHWKTPMDPNGRWICFDRTRKSGPYDRIYADTTGNGKLEDKTAIKAATVDQYNAMFEPLRMVFKGEDGPITYHLLLRFMKYSDDDTRVLAEAGGYYSGSVDIGGKKRQIELTDGNVNGTFNDLGTDPDSCDHITVANDKGGQRALGRLLEVDGQLYNIEVARDGAFVKIQKAENVTLGKVLVSEKVTEVTAVGENGQFSRKPAKGEFTLPAGAYRIQQWQINRKDERGASWQLMGYRFGSEGNFKVAAETQATLKIGEPVRAILLPNESRSEVSFNLQFRGNLNESVDITKDSERPKPPRLTLTSLDGSYRYTNSFEFG